MATESQDKEFKEPIKTIKFEIPLEFGSETITEINFLRRPKAKDMKGLDPRNLTIDQSMKLLANISDLSVPQIKEMDLDEFNVVSAEMADAFLARSQKIGEGR